MDDSTTLDALFQRAVSAIDAGDVSELEDLVAVNPRLVRERLDAPGAWLRDKVGNALDGFFQRPYLLWFVAEDPVRNGQLPGNIADVTRAIIRAAEGEGGSLAIPVQHRPDVGLVQAAGDREGQVGSPLL